MGAGMRVSIHEQADIKIVEVMADTVIVRTPQDALELLMSLSYEHNVAKVILHQRNITLDFFDLKTRLAGEILQKVINYRMQLAIVGEFKNVQSDSLRAFMTESNRGRQIFFTNTVEAAKQILLSTHL